MDKDQALAEAEANYFASALLMPKKEFVAAWHKHAGDVIQLAILFNVHSNAVNYRVRHLQTQGLLQT